MLASVAIFLGYIHHIAQSIRVANIIASIGADTRALIERRHPLELDERDIAEHMPVDGSVGPSRLVAAGRPGIVVAVDDAMHQLHDLLRRLAVRPLPPLRRMTSDGRLAVFVPTPGFEDYLVLAVDEIARWGSDADRVQNRLRGMLRDLHGAALPAHRAAIARQLLCWDEQLGQTGEPDLTPSDVGLRPSPSWDSGRS